MDLVTYPEDLSSEEQNSLTSYIQNGCPGLTKIDETQVFKWFELYMRGKSYHEIASLTKDKKDLILYIAYKSKWHEKRMEYYRDLTTTYTNKMRHIKLESANTIMTAITALGKYYNDHFNKFLMTNDKSIIDNLDTKNLAQYYKSLEILDKIMNPGKGSGHSDDLPDTNKAPLVNINVKNVQVSQDGNTIDISTDSNANSADEKAASALLKALSEFQRSKNKD